MTAVERRRLVHRLGRRTAVMMLRRLPPPAVLVLRRVTPSRLRVALAGKSDWAIGLVAGRSPLDLDPVPSRPLLTADHVTDVKADFVADPFAVRDDGCWHLLFEVLDRATAKGVIAAARSDDLTTWQYDGVVLREPFHLSYPFVFRWDDSYFMIPETAEANEVRLYRADDFPRSWSLDRILLSGRPYRDSSLLEHDGRWWMFTETDEHNRHSQLRLYVAPAPTGPWTEHVDSPVVSDDPGSARPAGRPFQHAGRLYRLAQDCRTHYGEQVRAFEILTLSVDCYEEREVDTSPILRPTHWAWSRTGAHHVEPFEITAGRWVAFIDAT